MAYNSLSRVADFPSLVEYLSDELGWPVDLNSFEDRSELAEELTYDYLYDPEKLGIPEEIQSKVRQLRQMIPLAENQPWAVFYVELESKRLPVTVLRRILNLFVEKKRASSADRVTWKMQDLLFVNAHGADEDRAMTFAHFSPPETGYTAVMREFMWSRKETHLAHTRRYMDSLQWPDEGVTQQKWRAQWRSAFVGSKRKAIKDSRDLAEEMALFANEVRQRVSEVLELTRKKTSDPLQQLYASFRKFLIHDLKEDDFADTYSQTMAYGLFSARAAKPEEDFRLKNAPDKIPPTNPFLRSLFRQCLGLSSVGGGRIDIEELGVRRLVELFGGLSYEDVKRILDEFGSQTGDPVIHFYENFLAEYDKEKKVQRGVFYTPEPVVSYIVRGVHELLQTEFGIEDGLASTVTWGEITARNDGIKIPDNVSSDEPFVLILDPATGTATFLVEVIDVIFQHLEAKWKGTGGREMPPIARLSGPFKSFKDYWNNYVLHALLTRLYGYELMMAPYTIAHMKLGLKLSEINAHLGQPDYQFNFENRAHIYLTNSLEPPSDEGQQALSGLFPGLAHEAKAVNEIKHKKRFTVVIGNPPYSVSTQNRGVWASALIDRYKKGLNEKKHTLDDDYVKFVAFSQWQIDRSSTGVFGFITNHGYLKNPTFRVMRQSLMECFSKIMVRDLHGNVRQKEATGSVVDDENVFDIQQGVVVTLACKNNRVHEPPQAFFSELWGTRAEKYKHLANSTISSIQWHRLILAEPFYLFVPQDESKRDEYSRWPSLVEAFICYGSGIKTDRDKLCIDSDRSELSERMRTLFSGKYDSDFIERFNVRPSSSYNIVEIARRAKFSERDLRSCLYRPFDVRWLYYKRGFTSRPAWKVMQHMLPGDNIGLLSARTNKSGKMDHFFCTRLPTEVKVAESTTQSCVFPLYLVHESESLKLSKQRTLNFTRPFLKAISSVLGLRGDAAMLPKKVSGEDVISYAYAVFFSPTYRTRYAEFLKIDYPRIPISGSFGLFNVLAKIGKDLVALHLMDSPYLDDYITTLVGLGEFQVEKVNYSDETVWINKAKTHGFRNVPEEVWNFHIGGYQVCEKWLKDRQAKVGKNPQAGRVLSSEDIAHYQKIVVALNETIRLMDEIDEVIEEHGGWPDAFIS